MKKEYNQIKDFLEEDSFREWVFSDGNYRNLYWETWCQNHPEKKELFLEAREILLSIGGREMEWEEENRDKVLASINRILDEEEAEEMNIINITSSQHQNKKIWLKASVAFLAMAISAVIGWQLGVFTQSGLKDGSGENQSAWISKSTNAGEKKRIHLPDGSTVIMNSSSEIRYKSGFGETHRDILLEGESYFEVAKDSLTPFRVVSGKLTTVALGTAFNIKSFANENTSRIQLVEGKVSVENENLEGMGNDLIFLSPGEEASLSNLDFKKTRFNISTALLWTEGILYFDQVPFQEAMTALERWYGVEISTSGESGREHMVSGEFKQDNLYNVMKSLSYTFGFEFQIEDKNVNVQFRKR